MYGSRCVPVLDAAASQRCSDEFVLVFIRWMLFTLEVVILLHAVLLVAVLFAILGGRSEHVAAAKTLGLHRSRQWEENKEKC